VNANDDQYLTIHPSKS